MFPNGTSRAVAQFGYDAYGSVITAETLFAHALLRAGHKGLFFDRLDLGIVDGMTLEESPRLAVGADLIGYARNRAYSPRLGRWVQRDPNGAGAIVLGELDGRAAPRPPIVTALDIASMYSDGANLFQYLGENPMERADALGLEYSLMSLQMASNEYSYLQSTQSAQHAAWIAAAESQMVAGGASLGLFGGGGALGTLTGVKALVAYFSAGSLVAGPTGALLVAAHFVQPHVSEDWPRGPSESPVWRALKAFKGKIKTNGLPGSKKQYYQWDYSHNDIEVYSSNRVHMGVMHPMEGWLYKPPVPGRKLRF